MCNDATVIIEPNEVLSTVVVETECSEFTIEVAGLGQQGLSAYQIAVINGFEGTEEEWLESLKAIASMANIEDVTITDAKNKQTLTYNGTKWINAYSWQYLVMNAKTNGVKIPILAGFYLAYTLQGSTIYRYITTARDANNYPLEDAFYSTLSGGVLSNKIVERS
jgi:hypothetical protein